MTLLNISGGTPMAVAEQLTRVAITAERSVDARRRDAVCAAIYALTGIDPTRFPPHKIVPVAIRRGSSDAQRVYVAPLGAATDPFDVPLAVVVVGEPTVAVIREAMGNRVSDAPYVCLGSVLDMTVYRTPLAGGA